MTFFSFIYNGTPPPLSTKTSPIFPKKNFFLTPGEERERATVL